MYLLLKLKKKAAEPLLPPKKTPTAVKIQECQFGERNGKYISKCTPVGLIVGALMENSIDLYFK